MWPKTNMDPLLPPQARKMPGRPKKQRRREKHEKPQKRRFTISRVGLVIKCTRCIEQEYNKSTCKNPEVVPTGNITPMTKAPRKKTNGPPVAFMPPRRSVPPVAAAMIDAQPHTVARSISQPPVVVRDIAPPPAARRIAPPPAVASNIAPPAAVRRIASPPATVLGLIQGELMLGVLILFWEFKHQLIALSLQLMSLKVQTSTTTTVQDVRTRGATTWNAY